MAASRSDLDRAKTGGAQPAVTGTVELPVLAKRPDRVVAILDDDATTCQMLARIIERLGMKPAATTDPSHLFDMIAGDPYAVLLDLSMPGMNGLDVIRMLAEHRVKSRIVLISGHDDVVLGAARELGTRRGLDMAGALRKPIPVGELRRLLDRPDETGATSCTRLVPLIDPERLSADDVLRMLRAHFQPQVNFATGAWEGVEALARIDHPEFGLLPPSAMMHVADDPRTAPAIALRTVDLALACWRDLAQQVGYPGTVSVNLSAACLGAGDFPAELLARCGQSGCGPDRLMMEVTETAVPEDAVEAMDILISLRLKGFTLSIDDFGTGHSSLEQLQFLPFSEVKIDKTFIAAAEYSPRSRAIVDNVISLAHHIGADVVAEGVESARTWTWLRQAGCDRAQGFFVARPMAPDELPAWHARWRERFPKL